MGKKKAKAAEPIPWLQCDLCEKWRRIPADVDLSAFEGKECVRGRAPPFPLHAHILTPALHTHAQMQVVLQRQCL